MWVPVKGRGIERVVDSERPPTPYSSRSSPHLPPPDSRLPHSFLCFSLCACACVCIYQPLSLKTLQHNTSTTDAPPELWADLVGVSPVTPLTQSPPPSGNNSDEEEEEEGEGEGEGGGGGEREGQEQEQQQLEVKQQQQSAAEKQPAAGGQEALQQEQQEEEQRPQADSSSSSSKSSSNIQAAPSLPSQQPPQPPPSAAAAAANTAVSFLVLCDPKFPQVRQLLAGLDFAFPDANKVCLCVCQLGFKRAKV